MPIAFEDYETAQMARAARTIAADNGRTSCPFLPADARAVWDDCDMMAEDWGDAEASALNMLWSLCEVLRGYESPAWGNTGGRYEHSGGFMDEADWAALKIEDYYYADADMVDGDWPTMVGAVRQLDKHDNLRGVIQMADILDMAIDMAQANA